MLKIWEGKRPWKGKREGEKRQRGKEVCAKKEKERRELLVIQTHSLSVNQHWTKFISEKLIITSLAENLDKHQRHKTIYKAAVHLFNKHSTTTHWLFSLLLVLLVRADETFLSEGMKQEVLISLWATSHQCATLEKKNFTRCCHENRWGSVDLHTSWPNKSKDSDFQKMACLQ